MSVPKIKEYHGNIVLHYCIEHTKKPNKEEIIGFIEEKLNDIGNHPWGCLSLYLDEK